MIALVKTENRKCTGDESRIATLNTCIILFLYNLPLSFLIFFDNLSHSYRILKRKNSGCSVFSKEISRVFHTQFKKIVTLCVAVFFVMPILTLAMSESANDADRSLEIKLAKLENEIQSLKRHIKRSHHSETVKQKKKSEASSPSSHSLPRHHKKSPSQAEQETQVTFQPSSASANKLSAEEPIYLPFDVDVPGRAFVSTGPYVSVPIQFSGSNLIINSPSVNTDVQLLGLRKSIIQHLEVMGGPVAKEPYYSHLLFSGIIEAQASYTDLGGKPSTTDIDLTNVSLDAFILGPSDWILGFVELSVDNGLPSGSSFRVSNSHVYLNKGFITIGNFQQSPFYGSLGQFYVPFGTYSSVMVSDPLTKLLARTKARSILLGIQQQDKNAFYAAGYVFRGDTHAASVSKINNGGINIGYKFAPCLMGGKISGDVGAGVIGNLTDSAGMQNGAGFSSNEQLVHRVPAYNLRGIFHLGEKVDIITEYVTASTAYNTADMTFNNHGAKPWAVDAEASYTFTMLNDKPSSLGIGYAMTGQALAVGLPLDRYSIVLNTSLLRNTVQSLEIHRDREYAASKTASVGGVGSPQESGKLDRVVVAQFDYYF
jgi:hypothetical protein